MDLQTATAPLDVNVIATDADHVDVARLESSPSGVPVLEATRSSAAERLGIRLSGHHPALVFVMTIALGYALLLASSIALGLLVTKLVLSFDGVARADERLPDWLATERTSELVDASWVGSTLAGGVVIPLVIASVLLACALKRRWRVGAFVLFAVAVESATYRVTSLAVPRERPTVDRLESLPADASFPSGHTAASIALYCGLALLLTSRLRNGYARTVIWIVALTIPPFVAWSRMLRGMHHPLDVAGGVAIGIGAILVVLFAARAAGAAAERRSAQATTRGA